MFGLRFVSFAIAAFLCATTNVAAIPVQKFSPGDIVYHNTDHTRSTEYPHIVIGHQEGNMLSVAPFVRNLHGHSSHMFLPLGSLPSDTDIQGHVALDELKVHTGSVWVPPNRPAVSKNGMDALGAARSLVKMHGRAAKAHYKVFQANSKLEDIHMQQSYHHAEKGDLDTAIHHLEKAKQYKNDGERHRQEAVKHHVAAHHVYGPDVDAKNRAMKSTGDASLAFHSLQETVKHNELAQHYHHQNNLVASQYHSDLAHMASQAAHLSSQKSVSHFPHHR